MKAKPFFGRGDFLLALLIIAIAGFICINFSAPSRLMTPPIERAIATCSTPNQQPAWVRSTPHHVQVNKYLGYSYYNKDGLVERWVARIISATIQQDDGRVTLDFVYTHNVQIEYVGWLGFHYWKTPILSEEEYGSYYSLGQSYLALWGGDQKWAGVDAVSYYLHFNRSNRLESIGCPGGARLDLSQIK